MSASLTCLIHSQVDACIRDDAQHVGNVALVEGSEALSLQDLLGAVCDSRVLARLSQRQPRLNHLQGNTAAWKSKREVTHCSETLLRKQPQQLYMTAATHRVWVYLLLPPVGRRHSELWLRPTSRRQTSRGFAGFLFGCRLALLS